MKHRQEFHVNEHQEVLPANAVDVSPDAAGVRAPLPPSAQRPNYTIQSPVLKKHVCFHPIWRDIWRGRYYFLRFSD